MVQTCQGYEICLTRCFKLKWNYVLADLPLLLCLGVVPLPGHLPISTGGLAELPGVGILCHRRTDPHKKQVRLEHWHTSSHNVYSLPLFLLPSLPPSLPPSLRSSLPPSLPPSLRSSLPPSLPPFLFLSFPPFPSSVPLFPISPYIIIFFALLFPLFLSSRFSPFFLLLSSPILSRLIQSSASDQLFYIVTKCNTNLAINISFISLLFSALDVSSN